MKHIFLSASIPDQRRSPRYYASADLVAIRDAVRALATVVLPHATLYWGGHPAITPLIRAVADSMGLTGSHRVQLFQSAWFSEEFPADNAALEAYVLTAKMRTRRESLKEMREVMLRSAGFDAGIFIGGMSGVEEEFRLYRRHHPDAQVLPIASTGAAASILYERLKTKLALSPDLANNYAYPTLFRTLLDLPIKAEEG